MTPLSFVVLKCTGDECGMRYPSPPDDPRRESCPLCESPTVELGAYDPPPSHSPLSRASDASSLVGVLDNIRSALNVGTMMRSADGADLDHLYLTGLTAGADNPKVIKTALGAQATVPSTSALDGLACVEQLIDEGYEIWAIEYTEQSRPLQQMTTIPSKLAFVVGNETAGVDPALLERAARHVHLDMYGAKSTLNVGVVFGTVAHWLRTAAEAR